MGPTGALVQQRASIVRPRDAQESMHKYKPHNSNVHAHPCLREHCCARSLLLAIALKRRALNARGKAIICWSALGQQKLAVSVAAMVGIT
eukprot:8783664-Pyramimonas_sp.AAC.1